MRISLECVAPVLAVLASGSAVAVLVGVPTALADPNTTPAPPTVTVVAPAPGPQDNQGCTSSASATKCVSPGDAEVNAAIPAPYPGSYGSYGPFWGGQGTRIKPGS